MSVIKAMGVVAGLGVLFLAGSYPFRNDEHGWKWIVGGAGWFGFLLCVLALILLALVKAVSLVRGRRVRAI